MNIRSLVLATFVLAAAVPLAWQQAASNAPPAKLWAAQTGPKEITLVWTRVQGGVRYRIYEATGGDAKLVGQTMASGEQYVRPVSAYDIAHRFAIEVVFENGEVSARAPFNPVVPQEARPGAVTAPASVKTAPSGAGTISITWDGVPGATAYRIARQIVPGGFQMLCRLCPTDTTYVDHTANGGARGRTRRQSWRAWRPRLCRGPWRWGPPAAAPAFRRLGDAAEPVETPTHGHCHNRANGFDLHAGLVMPAGQRERL